MEHIKTPIFAQHHGMYCVTNLFDVDRYPLATIPDEIGREKVLEIVHAVNEHDAREALIAEFVAVCETQQKLLQHILDGYESAQIDFDWYDFDPNEYQQAISRGAAVLDKAKEAQ